VTQLLIYVGLAVGTATYGFAAYWAMIGLAVLGAYVHLPLLVMPLTRTVREAPVASGPVAA
jgi:hypothetical protein